MVQLMAKNKKKEDKEEIKEEGENKPRYFLYQSKDVEPSEPMQDIIKEEVQAEKQVQMSGNVVKKLLDICLDSILKNIKKVKSFGNIDRIVPEGNGWNEYLVDIDM